MILNVDSVGELTIVRLRNKESIILLAGVAKSTAGTADVHECVHA